MTIGDKSLLTIQVVNYDDDIDNNDDDNLCNTDTNLNEITEIKWYNFFLTRYVVFFMYIFATYLQQIIEHIQNIILNIN